ncbi:MAG: hypothetical protein IT329_22725 [Caldilineaceae bacterium]|nr:hypothetical protein [Caldilineaceae bacterium]
MQPYPIHNLGLIVEAGRLWLRLDHCSRLNFPAAYRARLIAAASRAAARWERREAKYPPAKWFDPVSHTYRHR